ncbi:MAG: hypothetical protein KDD53_06645 [Bdellovibrionales bacterium]|nr:hypothetical protein [Bdellovibrionales bacterium]
MLIRSDSGQENGAIDLIVVVLFLPVLFAVIAIALDYSRGPIASRTLENALRNAAWGVVPPIFSSNECLSLGSVPPMIYNAGVPTNPVPPGTSNPGNTLGPSENYCDAYPWMSQIDSSDTWGLEVFTPAAHNFAELSDKINNSVGLESHRDTPKPCVEQAAANLNSSFFNEAVSLKYAELAAYLTAKSLASGSSWLFDYVSDDEISGAAGGDSPLAIAMGVVWISANDTTGEFSTSGYPVYTGSPGYFPAGATGASLVNDYSSQSGLSNNSPRQIVSELVSQAQSVG